MEGWAARVAAGSEEVAWAAEGWAEAVAAGSEVAALEVEDWAEEEVAALAAGGRGGEGAKG